MTAEMKDWMVNFSVYLTAEEHNDRKYTNMQALSKCTFVTFESVQKFFNTELCVCFMKKRNKAV